MDATKICTKCGIDKPLDDYYKTKRDEDTRYGDCKKCRIKRYTDSYARDPTAVKARTREHFAQHPEAVRAANLKWTKENPEARNAIRRRWGKRNLKAERERVKKWAKNNPEKRTANRARRRAAKINRTPPWADKKAILKVYGEARALQEATGEPYHVDHIYPLQGEKISGLHVDGNLRAVPARVNLSKSNNFDPDNH